MNTHPQIRPGGRAERVRQAVLAAADDLADSGEEVSVAALASRSGVSEVTIYRRWGNAQNVVVEAAVSDTVRRLPLKPTGNLQRDLTDWARNAERSLATRRGGRLLAAVMGARLTNDAPTDAADVRRYLDLRASQVQAVLDAADPATTLTVGDVLDQVLAPIYLRRLFGYRGSRSAARLVSDLVAGPRNAHRPTKRQASARQQGSLRN
jgi:AcrR family transcriptional regulator